eukprot:scaffold3552_cov140-Skeletonema_marinoi.AAC.6
MEMLMQPSLSFMIIITLWAAPRRTPSPPKPIIKSIMPFNHLSEASLRKQRKRGCRSTSSAMFFVSVCVPTMFSVMLSMGNVMGARHHLGRHHH